MNLILLCIIITVLAVFLGAFVSCYLAGILQEKRAAKIPVIELLPEEDENASTREEEKEAFLPKEGEYTGILHIANGKYKFERPVMSTYSESLKRAIYFEYNEKGEKVILSKKELRDNIKAMLQDHTYKCSNLKWYPVSRK